MLCEHFAMSCMQFGSVPVAAIGVETAASDVPAGLLSAIAIV